MIPALLCKGKILCDLLFQNQAMEKGNVNDVQQQRMKPDQITNQTIINLSNFKQSFVAGSKKCILAKTRFLWKLMFYYLGEKRGNDKFYTI